MEQPNIHLKYTILFLIIKEVAINNNDCKEKLIPLTQISLSQECGDFFVVARQLLNHLSL